MTRRPSTSTVTNSIAGAEVLGLAAVGERVDLAVAVLRAVGRGEHERVVRPLVVGRSVGGDLRARAADPHAVQPSLLGEELRRRPALGLAEVVAIGGEAGRERLAEQDEPRAGAGGAGDQRREVGEVGFAVAPDDVVLNGGDAHGRRLSRWPVWRAARRPRRAPRGACRTRTARGAGPRAGWRRTPRWGSPRRRTGRAGRGRTPCRRRRVARAGCRR